MNDTQSIKNLKLLRLQVDNIFGATGIRKRKDISGLHKRQIAIIVNNKR